MVSKRKTNRKITTIEVANQIDDLIKYGFTYVEVGKMYNKSKSAISGLVYRAKHMGYVDGVKNLDPSKSKVTAIKNIVEPMPPTTEGITIFELREDTCRAIIGEHKYCGCKVFKLSNCEEHYRQYRQIERKKK
jgi:hypothetical protein